MKKVDQLNAMAVRALKKRGTYADGKGLYLKVSDTGAKSWVFRYQCDGRERRMGLGSVHDVSLAEARDKRDDQRKRLKLEGLDPLDAQRDARRNAKVEKEKAEARNITFEAAGRRYIEANAPGWSERSRDTQIKKWERWLKYASALDDFPVAEIDTPLVLKVLEQEVNTPEGKKLFWYATPETANRVRLAIELVLRKYRKADNPAKWEDCIADHLPDPQKIQQTQNFRSLPYPLIPQFMKDLRALGGVAPRALELTVLTGMRSGSEARLAKWDEFNLGAGIWTVPGERMKGKSGRPRPDHRVPMSPRALAIVKALPRVEGNPYVFAGLRAGQPINEKAMLNLLKDMGVKDQATVHGFRSSFRTWADERTAFPFKVLETAIGHSVGRKSERAYDRSDAFAKRAQLMKAWASYCESEPVEPAEVVPIRAANLISGAP
jgi:integrase